MSGPEIKREAYRGCICRSCIEVYGEHHDQASEIGRLPPYGSRVIVFGVDIGKRDTLHECFRVAYSQGMSPVPWLYARVNAFKKIIGRMPADLEELYTWVKTGKVEDDGTG